MEPEKQPEIQEEKQEEEAVVSPICSKVFPSTQSARSSSVDLSSISNFF